MIDAGAETAGKIVCANNLMEVDANVMCTPQCSVVKMLNMKMENSKPMTSECTGE